MYRPEEVSVQERAEDGMPSFKRLPNACAQGDDVVTSYADDGAHTCTQGLT